jgi:hypothetical protein
VTLAMPLVLLLGIVVFLLVRSGELSGWQVVLVALFGFYLDRTHLADPIGHFVSYMIHRH